MINSGGSGHHGSIHLSQKRSHKLFDSASIRLPRKSACASPRVIRRKNPTPPGAAKTSEQKSPEGNID
jgi:hypothetical protein